VRARYPLAATGAGLRRKLRRQTRPSRCWLKLAEHVAIRFALDSYEKGGDTAGVNPAVKQLADRHETELRRLRKIPSTNQKR